MSGEQQDYREIVTVDHETQEYVTLVHGKKPPFSEVTLDNDEYSRALSSLVVACVDLLVVNGAYVLLGRRQQKPQADIWLFGGRMVAGMTYYQVATKNARRELSVTLALDRLSRRYIGHYSLVWDERQQPPQHHGCHTISHVFAYQAADGEFDHYNSEYSGLVWVPMSEILQDGGRRYHPMLRQVIKDYKWYRRWAWVRRIRDRLCTIFGYFRR